MSILGDLMRYGTGISQLVKNAKAIGALNPEVNQHTFAFYEDDSSDPDTCTRIGDVNNDPGGTSTWDADTNLMVRIGVENTNDRDWTGIGQLQYQVNGTGGTWNDVNSTSSVARTSTGTPSSGALCDTQLLDTPGTASTWENGNFNDTDALFDTGYSKDAFSECQACVQLRSADLSDADLVYFRVTNGTNTYSYARYPVIEVNIAAAGPTEGCGFIPI